MESKKLEYITFIIEHREKTIGDEIIYLLLLLISKVDVYILLLGTVQISGDCLTGGGLERPPNDHR